MKKGGMRMFSDNKPLKRVAAYCRVSTDKTDQKNSFEAQKEYFMRYIQNHAEWILYEIYTDEGITGTNTKKRKGFLKMLEDAETRCFDLLITKEISRFARNLLDSVYYTRMLKRFGIGVLFLNDNIFTLDGDAELRLAILASIAQEESRRTSERVKWGQKQRMEKGVVFGRSMLGYDVKDGKMTVNLEGAEIVRKIFYQFAEENFSISQIARNLDAEGILPMHAKNWNPSVILRILKNEKYKGDLKQKKTYTPDYLSHEKKINRGEEAFVWLCH
ncbi:MAG: recombinase family protein, partial [Clostridia bacterium]|nr:recombinase family protein [Clostridia bacterium]